jgi:hypothetical protein
MMLQGVGWCGSDPLVRLGVYVSVPACVVDLTVQMAYPPFVFWMLPFVRIVELPLVRLNETPYVPVVTTLPARSRTLTIPEDVDEPSAMIGFGLNVQARWSGPPEFHEAVALALERPALEKVITQAL